jgi:MFS family permease
VIIRLFQGFGDSIAMSTTYSLISLTFSDEKTIYIGYLQTCWGLGTLIGPTLGSIFYGIGGY